MLFTSSSSTADASSTFSQTLRPTLHDACRSTTSFTTSRLCHTYVSKRSLEIADRSAFDLATVAPTASARVFTSYELCQNIILHLPLRQILLARRTSKSFEDVFSGSVAVRRALFLAPSTSHTLDHYRTKLCRENDEGRGAESGEVNDKEDGEWRATENSKPVRPWKNPFVDSCASSYPDAICTNH